MKNKKTVLILVLGLAVLIVGASLLYNSLSDSAMPDMLATTPATQGLDTTEETAGEATEPQLTTAPDFTVYDLEGNAHNLSDFFGKPIVLNFWASWCGPCKSEMPDFDAAFLEQGEKLQFLMVNMTDGSRETVEIASEYVAQQEFSFPVYYDTVNSAAITYGVTSLPTTYFIDEDGYLIAYARGAINAELLQQGIDMILPPNQ